MPFLLRKNWCKKIQALGLVNLYKSLNSEESNFLKYFFGLLFLRPEEVEKYFVKNV